MILRPYQQRAIDDVVAHLDRRPVLVLPTGDWGTATAGSYGTVSAGDWGTVSIKWWDGNRDRLAVGYVGEDGIEPDTTYRADDTGKIVEADNGGDT